MYVGHIAEQGSPYTLLQKEEGKFRGMCEASGDWERLSNMIVNQPTENSNSNSK